MGDRCQGVCSDFFGAVEELFAVAAEEEGEAGEVGAEGVEVVGVASGEAGEGLAEVLTVVRGPVLEELEQPGPTIAKARINLDRLHSADRGNAARLLDEWDTLLDRPTDEVVTAMLARTQHGIDLRQMTPFAGVLTDTERRKALRSVAATNAA